MSYNNKEEVLGNMFEEDDFRIQVLVMGKDSCMAPGRDGRHQLVIKSSGEGVCLSCGWKGPVQ